MRERRAPALVERDTPVGDDVPPGSLSATDVVAVVVITGSDGVKWRASEFRL